MLLTGLIHPAMAQLKLLRDDASGGRPVTANPYTEVKGSAYLFDFQEGSILFSEKDTAFNLMIAFNVYENTLEYKIDDQLIAYHPDKISGFILNVGSYPRLFRSGYKIPKVGSKLFVEVLVDGEYKLISHHYKTIGDDLSATYGSQREKIFQTIEQLYVVSVGGEAHLVKTKPKYLNEVFQDDFTKAETIISNYSIDLKEKIDVIRFIELMNKQ